METSASKSAKQGPQAHIAKRDTPTMGGLLIIASVGDFDLCCGHGCRASMSGSSSLRHCAFGAVEFADDYLKLVKRRSLGLDRPAEAFFSVDLSAFCVWLVVVSSHQVLKYQVFMERQYSLFQKTRQFRTESAPIPSGLYLILIVVVLLGATNAVNLNGRPRRASRSAITFIAMTGVDGVQLI